MNEHTLHIISFLIPALPLLGFFIHVVSGKRISAKIAGLHASVWMVISFIFTCILFYQLQSTDAIETNLGTWITVGTLNIPFAFLVDHISIIMMLVITGVGSLIHIYSIAYMHNDEGINRFFAHMNLFVFFMLILVMANNYVLLFAGWEGVGLCSYLLIGYWFKNTAFNKAANKAFIMNRIGDLALLLGLFLLFQYYGSLSFASVFTTAQSWVPDKNTITVITILLFIGATGKSAQLPLYTWLPDAMAGPTPVSALIHAATMVTAGIYLIVRSNVLFMLSPFTMNVILITGLVTAIFAATIGLKQNDIKKVLAYSTVSQLGLMFFALGLGAFEAGLFHLITHAFFKALLFLAAGSIIHGMGGEQDIRKMGGLKNKMKITHAVFLIGTLTIAALPPFSGFFSKDYILLSAYERSPWLWISGMGASLITVFYMFRLYYVVFWGQTRNGEEINKPVHESPKVITIPLIILAIFSITGGIINLPALFRGNEAMQTYLKSVLPVQENTISTSTEWMLMLLSTILITAVIFIVQNKYVRKKSIPEADAEIKGFGKILSQKYYVDEIYNSAVVHPVQKFSSFLNKTFEKVIDGFVNGSGVMVNYFSSQLRLIQTGNIGFYLFVMVFGIIAVLIYNLFL